MGLTLWLNRTNMGTIGHVQQDLDFAAAVFGLICAKHLSDNEHDPKHTPITVSAFHAG